MAKIIDRHPDCFLLFSHKRLLFRIFFTIVRHFYFLYRHDHFMWLYQRFQFALIFIKIVWRRIKSSGRNNYSYKYRAPRNRLPMTREKNFFIAFVIVIFKYHFWCIFEVPVCLIGIYLRVVGKNFKNCFFDFENEIKWWIHEIGWNVKSKIDLCVIFSVSFHLCCFVWQNEFENVVIHGSLPYTCAYAN